MSGQRWAAAGAALLMLGQAYAAEPQCGGVVNNSALAIELCTKAIDSGRFAGLELAKAYHSRGTELAATGQHDRAIADFDVAVQLEPTFTSAVFNRALSWSAKGEHDRAISDYDTVLKLSPRDGSAHLGRAAEWIAKGDYKRAIADFDDATRLGQAASGYFGRGRAKFYAGDFMGAASDFYRAHQLEATIYTALWMFLARKRADIPGEKTLAQDAGTSGSGDWPAPIVALYLGRGTPAAVQSAATHLDAARQRTQRCEANYYIGEWHLLRGERDAAAKLLRDAVTTCPQGYIEYEGAVAELARLK